MTTGITTRSRDLQELVLTYFRSYHREAEVFHNPSIPGAVDVILRGSLAKRFETVTVPHQGQPSVRLLRLLFDTELAAIAPGYELIAPRSHVLRLIRNELAGRACFTRSAAVFNLDGTFSDLQVLGIELRHVAPDVTCRYVPRRFYAVRYMLRLSAYEKNEDTLLIVVDPARGVVLPAAEASRFAGLNLVDLSRAPYKNDLSPLKAESRKTLLHVFGLAENAAKTRVAAVLRHRAVELAVQLEQECDRVNRHFAAESRKASAARRLELERLRDQEIQELQKRYQVRCELTLVSLQEMVVPTVEYTLSILSGDTRVHIPQSFIFEPLTNSVMTRYCDECGQDRVWAYCARGNHLDCGVCGTVEKCSHPQCDQGACDTHAVRCDRCSVPVCAAHELACNYCQSHRRYCSKHIVLSFEGRYICPQCARFCGDCGKAFPAERSTVCAVCSGDFCDGHTRTCPSCGKHHCQEHGAVPRHRAEVYCHHCLARCAPCGGSALYLKADLQYCAECGSALCRDHINHCVTCGKVLCAVHALTGRQGKGCATCFAVCGTCGAVTHRSELQRCHLCPKTDDGLHCGAHLGTCELCKRRSCLEHIHTLVDNRRVCSGCSDLCAVCARRFSLQELATCYQCQRPFCSTHVQHSEFRDEYYCEDHAAFVACGGCDRRGPRFQLVTCRLCGMPYCPHCTGSSEGPFCRYCNNLQPLKEAASLIPWHEAVSRSSIPGLTRAQRAEILKALAGKDPAFSFTTSECKAYSILRASWKPGVLNYIRRFARTVTGFVVVCEKRSSHVELRINP
ncbi:MAG: hypothetical protein KatS3mg109_0436 [Pirellulaceae bacterium]|nr:MAG: hypothetical protein KatS3mg109_0436 [Pirellulaceae bacterium]